MNWITSCTRKKIQQSIYSNTKWSRRSICWLDKVTAVLSFYLLGSLLFFEQNESLYKCNNYYCGSKLKKKHFEITNNEISFFKHFPKYNMIQLYNSTPKYIQEENSISKFRLKLRKFEITKSYYESFYKQSF